MTDEPATRLARTLTFWVGGVVRVWPLTLLATLMLSVLAAHYVATNLGIDTSLDDMLSAELPFRKERAQFDEAFPQLRHGLVFVVDADTPEGARGAALDFADALREHPDRFGEVSVPRAEAFLEEHGLYFRSEEGLYDLSDQLAAFQPFLGRLTRDASIRGLFDMLDRAIQDRIDGGSYDVEPVLREVEKVLEAAEAGRPYTMSWQALMQEGDLEPDERRQFVRAQVVLERGSVQPAGRSLALARRLFGEQASDASGVRLRATGSLAMEHEEMGSVRRGAEWIGLLTFVLVGVILAVGLRSWRLVLASLLTLIVGLIFTAAFAAVTIGSLNMISVAFGVLYIGLGVDYAIHLALRVREGVLAGRSARQAVVQAASDVGGSLVLCTLTTAIGFFAFVPTAYRGVSQLGLIAGGGMFVSLFVSLTVMPALLVALPVRAERLARRGRVAGVLGGLADLPIRHRRAVLSGAVGLAILSLILLPWAYFDTNPLNLRDPDAESVRTFRDLLDTSETPPWSVTLLADDAGDAVRVKAALGALESVGHVISLASFVPADQVSKRAILDDLQLTLGPGLLDIRAIERPTLAEQRAAVEALRATVARARESGLDSGSFPALAGRLETFTVALTRPGAPALAAAVETSLLGTLPPNLRLLDRAIQAPPFEEAGLPPTLRRRWRAPDGRMRVEAFSKHDLDDMAQLESFVASVREALPRATGAPVSIVESGRAIVGAFRQALIVSVLACIAVLFILLRRPRDVLLVLVPLLFAGLVTGAATVVLDVPFNFANVIAIPLLFGIGVDSGIHVVHRGRGGLNSQAGGNPIRTSTGRAVVFSALTTIGSFGNLALSPHPGTASMGLLLAIGVTMTLVATIILLPALAYGRAKPAAS